MLAHVEKDLRKKPLCGTNQRLSVEFNQALKIRSIKGKTFKEPAEVTVNEEAKELPKVIAIDEYKGDTKEGKYQLIIANGITREPIDILPNRYKNTIKHYLRRYGS